MSETTEKNEGFTAEERAAMKERAKELREEKRRAKSADKAAEDTKALLAKIAEMEPADRAMAERIHEIVTAAAPDLAPKLWYGMPGYTKDGAVLVFFQDAAKFTARYSTLGFNDVAALDDGSMWPTSFALTELTPADEKRIAALVARAAG